ncbi:Breast cancer 2, early onset [Mortierella alpina]|nr:Breast cancer 2, early onset [Mortierella alpina]
MSQGRIRQQGHHSANNTNQYTEAEAEDVFCHRASLHTRFMETDSPTCVPSVVPSTQPMQKLPSFAGPAGAGHVDSPSESPSPEARIQWTQSLETPPKKRAGSGAVHSPRSSIIHQLRGLPPHASEKVTSPGEFTGWSPSMETPPRQANAKAEPPSVISENVLGKLRGMPPAAPLLDEGRASQDSQEDHYYSAASSTADAEDGYQQDVASSIDTNLLNGRSALPPNADSPTMAGIQSVSRDDIVSDVISLPDSVGLTLPSPLVQELELDADSPGISSPVIPSQDFSGSQVITDALDELQDVNPSRIESRSQDASSARLSRQLQLHDALAAVPCCPSAMDDRSQEASVRGGDTVAGTSISQDLDSMQLDSWSSPFGGSEVSPMGAKQQTTELHHAHPTRRRPSSTPAAEGALDDFADIRFSQLDDGFDIPDVIRKSQGMLPSSEDRSARLTTSAFMLQNDADMEDDSTPSGASVAPPSFGPVGFTRASGKKLAAPSRAALAHVAGLLENDADESRAIGQPNAPLNSGSDNGFRSAGGRTLAPISSAALAKAADLLGDMEPQNALDTAGPTMTMTGSESAKDFGGFQSAGGKALAPISKAAQERAARFLEDDLLKTELSYSVGGSHSAVMMSIMSTAEIANGAPQSMGFSSASGKTLPPVSKATLETWSRQLAEDSSTESAVETPFTAPSKSPQTGFTGFASGNGKRLAPVSEAAKARALGVLEVDDSLPVLPTTRLSSMEATAHGISKASPTATNHKGYAGAVSASAHFKAPTISSHMQKLKLKALRPISAAPLQPSIHKSSMKVSEPFKPSKPFKPPLRTHGGMSTATASSLNPMSESSGKSGADSMLGQEDDATQSTARAAADGATATTLISGRSSVVKRAALHPNARAAPHPVSLEVSLTPARVSHQVLFNVHGNGVRIGLNTLGPPQHEVSQSLIDIGVPEDVIYMSLDSAKTHTFGDWGIDEAYHGLLRRGAKQELLSRPWLENHYAMIVWKLACYVRSWPRHLLEAAAAGSGWFCPSKVLDQLAYRYEREINRAERPAVRKIIEGDESPAKHVVLAVAGIETSYAEEAKKEVLKVSVTDGWYVIPATLDACLTRAVERGRLRVGSKIHVCQARLTGAENGVAIHDVMVGSSAVAIILQANSTRLARWDKKLGFQKERVVRTTKLRTIVADGGLVPALDVVVLRKYPVMYMESLEDGTKIRRTASEEERAAEEYRDSMQKQYHDMVAEVQAKFGGDVDGSMSGVQPIRMQDEIRRKAADLEASAVDRNVVPFFSIRIGDYHCGGTGNWVPGSNRAFFAVTDSSRRLLLVEHHMAPHKSALPSFLKCQAKILMANVRYKLRDPKLDLDIVASTQNYTHIMAASPVLMASSVSTGAAGGATWPSYAQSSLLKLHELLTSIQDESSDRGQSSDGGASLVSLMARASTVLTGMQPCL